MPWIMNTSKILSSKVTVTDLEPNYGTLDPLHKDKVLDYSKLKAFTDDKINLTQKLKSVVG